MGESVHRGGATQVGATTVFVSAGTSVVIANFNGSRNALTAFNAGAAAIFAGYGSPAVPSAGMPIAAGQPLYEPDFIGTVSVISPAGTQPVFVLDVG